MYLTSSNGNSITVQGQLLDQHTRCVHYNTDIDVIALKFKCCGSYYPCYQCHQQSAGHEPEKFNITESPEELVVLCGNCHTELTFAQYSSSEPLSCIQCHHLFNKGCKAHYDLYFEMGQAKDKPTM